MLKLYSYFRSSASYRVRIALHWKELNFAYIPVPLLKDAQLTKDYRRINPMGHVPALDHDGFLIAESVAIVHYLDETFGGKKLFPSAPRDRAQVMQICELVNSGIQPLQNLKVQKVLEQTYHLAKTDSDGFVRHWIQDGLGNLESLLSRTAGTHCFGGEVTAADAFVIPQLLTAGRFGVDVSGYANLARIDANALKLPAFQKAHPEKQPDFQ